MTKWTWTQTWSGNEILFPNDLLYFCSKPLYIIFPATSHHPSLNQRNSALGDVLRPWTFVVVFFFVLSVERCCWLTDNFRLESFSKANSDSAKVNYRKMSPPGQKRKHKLLHHITPMMDLLLSLSYLKRNSETRDKLNIKTFWNLTAKLFNCVVNK